MVYHTNMSTAGRTPIPPQTGAMLRWAWDAWVDELMARVAAAGFDDLRAVHRPILRDLLFDGQRPGQLAARLGLSKQAVNDILREFEAKGYITLEPDPGDGRAKRIVLTDRGWAFGKTVEQLSRAISRRWAAEVGHERYAIFEDVLKDIAIKARARRDPPTNPSPAEPPARPAHKAPETPAT
jgi:DNA-binding MarR family transcriptional regulator